jgi:hypothetical protein
MASLPKKFVRGLGKIAKQTGEAVVKETVEMGKAAARQAGLSTEGDKGVEKPSGGGMTAQQMAQLKKKQEEERKKLEFYRQKLREYTEAAKKPPPLTEEQIKAMQEAEEEEEPLAPPPKIEGKRKRGTALLGRRKKGKGTGEVGGFAKRSR